MHADSRACVVTRTRKLRREQSPFGLHTDVHAAVARHVRVRLGPVESGAAAEDGEARLVVHARGAQVGANLGGRAEAELVAAPEGDGTRAFGLAALGPIDAVHAARKETRRGIGLRHTRV